jgi:hypothetical protein
MLRPKKVRGMWKIQHNGALHGLYGLPNVGVIKLRRMRLAVHVARVGLGDKTYSFKKSGGKTILARPRRRWEDNSTY